MQIKSKISEIIFGLIMLLLATPVLAQSSLPDNPKISYPYVKHNSSVLESFPDNANLNVFFSKLHKLRIPGNKGISVLHIGGSHIQGGVWSLEMKYLFEDLYPGTEGSMGLIFPFGLAKTNHPYYYTTTTKGLWNTCRITDTNPQRAIGLAGIMAYTTDQVAEIEVVFNEKAEIENHKFDKISVFHNIESDCYDISVFPDSYLIGKNVNYETGATEFYFTEPLSSIKIILTQKESGEFHFYGMYTEKSSGGINYSGIGINGAKTKSYLNASLFTRHLKAVSPDLVILSIGVNDAAESGFSQSAYERNYEAIIESILKVNPKCAIIFTTNNDFYSYSGKLNLNQDKVYESMCNLSRSYNASVWNLYNIMGGLASISLWHNDELAKKDRIHFTVNGYKLVANLFFEAISKEFKMYLDENSMYTEN